jgi:hypothetical protein
VLTTVDPAIQTAVDSFIGSLSTTQIGFQCTLSTKDAYIPGTVPEHLYKHAAKAHQSDDSELDGVFILTPDIQAPTAEEVAAVQAEVGDDALTKAIEAVKVSVRTSCRTRVDTTKVKANKAAEAEAE